tara:strand:- start:1270 stop:1668 length:399 start_codon:yes stop_codon:yes gene_type:complete
MATINVAQRPLELLGGYQLCAQFDIDFAKNPLKAGDVLVFGLLEKNALITGSVVEVLTAGAGTADVGSGAVPVGLFTALDLATPAITRSAGALLDTRNAGEVSLQLTASADVDAGTARFYVEYDQTELVEIP